MPDLPLDNAQHYSGEVARWYRAVYSWKGDDIPFYEALAAEYAGEGGHVLELAAGDGRISLPLARRGFRVTATDASADMLAGLRARLATEDPRVQERVEPLHEDMRRLHLDRLFRFVYLSFNTLLVLAQPHERQQALDSVREHLAPSGAFAFDIFTPDPRRLVDEPDWVVELEHEAEDAHDGGRVHVLRERRRHLDPGRQLIHVEFRNTISRDGAPAAHWEEALDLAYVFPRELELMLERQGFRIKARYGGPDRRPYAPTMDDVQPMYVVALLVP